MSKFSESLSAFKLAKFNGACLAFKYWTEAADPIATNRTTDTPLPPREGGEDYHKWLAKSYATSLVPKLGHEQGHALAQTQSAKQLHAHGRLTDILEKLNPDQKPVVSPGAGMAHEQAVAPHMAWRGFEYQPENVEGANERNKIFGVPNAENKQWSLYDGNEKDLRDVTKNPANQVHADWEQRLGNKSLPKGEHNFMYLKHFCGGGTDASLKHAAEQGYHGIVAHTCCSNRYQGVSQNIIGDNAGMPWPEYKKLVSASGDKMTERGVDAQMGIDAMRKKYLEDRGYVVRQGWFGKNGKWEPSGGFLLAVRADQPHLVERLQHPDLLKNHETFADTHQPQAAEA